MKRMIVVMLGMLHVVSVSAGLMRAGSSDSVAKALAQSPYTVMFLYDTSKTQVPDATARARMRELDDVVISLSKNPDYKAADLLFMRVDVGRQKYDEMLGLYRIVELPAVRFFMGNQMVGGINGFFYREQLQSQIDTYFKAAMNRTLQEKARQRKREFERAQINAAYWAPYWGPYWAYGYSPYWNGPYFGGSYGFYLGW